MRIRFALFPARIKTTCASNGLLCARSRRREPQSPPQEDSEARGGSGEQNCSWRGIALNASSPISRNPSPCVQTMQTLYLIMDNEPVYIKFPILQVIQRPANALKEMIENRFAQGDFYNE